MPSRSLTHYSTSSDDFDFDSIAALMARARLRWPRSVVRYSPTRKVPRRFRRADVNDRDVLRKIHEFQCGALAIKPASLVEKLKFSKPTLTTCTGTPLITSSKASPKPSNDNRLPVWEDGSRRLKIAMANEALHGAGRQVASFTLNLSPAHIETAQRHPDGFIDHLKRHLDKTLGRALGFVPLHWFAVDVAANNRLHLQGGIAFDLEQLDQIMAALIHVGGKWASKRNADKQLHMNLQRCDQGWVNYDLRHSGAVRKLIRGRTYTIAGPLRSAAKALYDAYRAAIRS
jgi:hypothetical protein